ncbi:uncharacterized protein LOC143370182 [Andrena cerasifolii]|uniref:uncharacterized protein LOC143370182 n=1 Tax=Andrena cerasifolii TaxID=2819439 RepID=UPI0040379FDA
MDILDEITGIGGRIAHVYRNFLLSFLISFVTLPLVNPMLDIVIPLNETREREEIFSLYYFVNNEEHFYLIYVHSVWCSTVTIVIIVTVDSLNMIITHHASAMFAICGSMIDKATECNDVATVGRGSMDDGLEKIKECVAAHNKAIQFFDFLDATNRMNFLLQVGFNIIGITVSAFQVRDDSLRQCRQRGTDERTEILFHRRLGTWMTRKKPSDTSFSSADRNFICSSSVCPGKYSRITAQKYSTICTFSIT